MLKPSEIWKNFNWLTFQFFELFLAYLLLQFNSYRLQMFYKKTQTAELSKYCWKKTAKGTVQTSENICSGNIQQVCTLAPFISLHVFALFLCQWTLYFFATSFTHLVFISVVKFLHSCIGASGPDPFYAGHKHNIYDPKFSVNKCYISGQKMRETFFTSSSTFTLFHSSTGQQSAISNLHLHLCL